MNLFTARAGFSPSLQVLIEAAKSTTEDPLAAGRGKHLKTRVREALSQTGKAGLLTKITECGRGQLCSSVYCTDCHRRLTQRFEAKIREYVENSGLDETQVRARFRYMTVICAVTKLSSIAVGKAMSRSRVRMKAVHRHFPKLWYYGAFDLELIRPELLGEHKAETIDVMGEDRLAVTMENGGTYVLVHFHALIDIGEEHGSLVRDRIARRFGHAPRQVRLDRLYEHQSIDEALAKISNYAYKHERKFKSSFSPKETYLSTYIEPTHLSFLISLYDEMKGDNGRGLVICGKPKKERIIRDHNNEIEFLDNDLLL